MLLFVLPAYTNMGNELATALGIGLGYYTIERFPNHELHAAIQMEVVNEECLLLGTIAPPDKQLLSTLLLSHTLKKEGARTVIALLPYLAYARDDTSDLWQRLWTLGVKRMYCTDTVAPAQARTPANIRTLSVLPLLYDHLRAREQNLC